tara:strand:+ start:105 stop:404 length:300 start_codon:yes stop_codon:yes gene_type:complete
MSLFEDLKFAKHPAGLAWSGNKHFKNGYKISVAAGESMYSTPKLYLRSPGDYTTYEIAVLDKDNEWATKQFFPEHNDDVLGWLTKEEVSELMQRIENTK